MMNAKLKSEVRNMKFKVRELREELGLSQEELSQKAKVSRTIISGLESGTIEVTTTNTLLKLADALGKKVQDIILP
jgi:transcriptional regulator with XRE-family HTH domain